MVLKTLSATRSMAGSIIVTIVTNSASQNVLQVVVKLTNIIIVGIAVRSTQSVRTGTEVPAAPVQRENTSTLTGVKIVASTV